ncbi:hypothetical protein GEO21_22710 [Sphingobacterium faecium]|uniref:hypothetical protein n=1 Tax=Sphingobacterium faecium TaxID=34087 RepID=UPI001291BAB7|nr:hypothetical protein [Sphingobacterium faecium]MQP30299.1 hypothetical protein [Sphingobacterium faecium]
MIVNKILYLPILIFSILGCTQGSKFDNSIMEEFQKCKGDKGCILDMAKAFDFDWDTVYYFSGKYSLEEINKLVGFEIKNYNDVGARLIFVHKERDVYSYEWFPSPENLKERVYVLTDLESFKLDRNSAKFKMEEINNTIFIEQPPFKNSKEEVLKIRNH